MVIFHLKKFLTFLFNAKIVTASSIDLFNCSVKGLQKTLNKDKARSAMKSSLYDRSQVLNADVNEFINHPLVVEALEDLSEGVNADNYYKVMFLIGTLILSSGTRPGALASMSISDINNFTTTVDNNQRYHVVSIAEHKTESLGPVDLPMTEREHEALTAVCRYTQSVYPDATRPFISFGLGVGQGGSPYPVSRLNYELCKAWKRTGMLSKYGPVNATKNRKRIATLMARDHPEMQEVTAKVLKHSKATEKVSIIF